MKIVFILFTFLLFTGCASLGENLAGHSYNDIKKMDLEGKDPVEVKKMLGVPVFEGFHEGKGGQEVHNGIGFSYSLVYSTKTQARYSYNLDKNKSCVILVFKKSKQFKYDGRTRNWAYSSCNIGGLQKYGLKEFNAEKFIAKYGY